MLRHLWLRRWVGGALLVLLSLAARAGVLVVGEAGSFVFDSVGAAGKPITVHYYKPSQAGPQAKVLIAIHGVERNGQSARDHWVQYAQANQVIVLAPEFDERRFPTRLFQFGGMQGRDRSAWTFSVIEELFAKVQEEEGLQTSSYMLFGHSAGAQFVHRFVLMMEQAHYSVAVAANAGSYTLPVYAGAGAEFSFPWSLDEQHVPMAQLRAELARHLIIMLGEKDVATDARNLSHSREAMAQGAYRFARGQHFYALAQSQATRMGTPLQWQLMTVPGVGHDSRRMSQAAAKVLGLAAGGANASGPLVAPGGARTPETAASSQ